MSNHSERAFKPIGPATTGYIFPAELVYHLPTALQGLYKFGYYYDTSNTEQIDNLSERTNKRWGAYFLTDQTVWQSTWAAERNLHIFALLTKTDRATFPFRHWYSTGIVFNAPFNTRLNDAIAVGIGRAVYNSDSRRHAIRNLADSAAADNIFGLAMGETLLEMTYSLQATSKLSIRSSLQYNKNLGAFSKKNISNAWVKGNTSQS